MQNVYLVVITVCINENYPKYVTGLCLLMGALDFILFSSCFFLKYLYSQMVLPFRNSYLYIATRNSGRFAPFFLAPAVGRRPLGPPHGGLWPPLSDLCLSNYHLKSTLGNGKKKN